MVEEESMMNCRKMEMFLNEVIRRYGGKEKEQRWKREEETCKKMWKMSIFNREMILK